MLELSCENATVGTNGLMATSAPELIRPSVAEYITYSILLIIYISTLLMILLIMHTVTYNAYFIMHTV